MQQSKKIGIVWFTTNLRIIDNQALYEACNECDQVIGVYIFNPKHYHTSFKNIKKTDVFRSKFIIETVQNLSENLSKLNISLVIAHKTPAEVFKILNQKHPIHTIYRQEEWFYEENEAINDVTTAVNKPFKSYYSQCLLTPTILDKTDFPKTFTRFRKIIEKITPDSLIETPIMPKNNLIDCDNLCPSVYDLGFDYIPESVPHNAFPFYGGETEGKARLDFYLNEKHILTYKATRNGLLGLNYSSKLSAWLALGALSPRYIFHKIKAFEKAVKKNQSTYWMVFELYWREFFKHLGYHYNDQLFKIDGVNKQHYKWSKDYQLFTQWTQGCTSEPFVNANMIELASTGWMSNRGRQICASYLSKHLGIDWRWGAKYFESLLIDYDPDSNYGNWMYLSGVGNDPRDRVFNVEFQQKRYDPEFKYINTWLAQIPS